MYNICYFLYDVHSLESQRNENNILYPGDNGE